MKGVHANTAELGELMNICDDVHQHGDRMQMAYAYYPHQGAPLELAYLASMGSKKPFEFWRCPLKNNQKSVPSLALRSPLLGWYEREITDLFGVRFEGHPEPYPLILNAGENGQPIMTDANKTNAIQALPYGPIRAGVTESSELFYFYAGEHILHFYQQLFFKHRGMEKRFEGLPINLGVILAERVSGVSSVAHALAYCQAIETACECDVPLLAKQWRIILAELERLYNHLHYLGYLCHTTTLKVGEAQGVLLEERLKQLNAKVTGSRFLREILTPGGLRRKPDMMPIKKELEKLRKAIREYAINLENTNTHLDRLIGTGVLSKEVAFDEGATGPICRASGIVRDFRHDNPYSGYEHYEFVIPYREAGDAEARMQIRITEIEISFDIIHQVLFNLSDGPIREACEIIPNSCGLGWAESPRGGLFYAAHFDEKRNLSRVKIKSPSFSNWRAFPFTVHDSNMMDYAINEASFGLTIAGCDR